MVFHWIQTSLLQFKCTALEMKWMRTRRRFPVLLFQHTVVFWYQTKSCFLIRSQHSDWLISSYLITKLCIRAEMYQPGRVCCFAHPLLFLCGTPHLDDSHIHKFYYRNALIWITRTCTRAHTHKHIHSLWAEFISTCTSFSSESSDIPVCIIKLLSLRTRNKKIEMLERGMQGWAGNERGGRQRW